jgi:DNA-binding LacI/PurR family transcriptional regulator
VSLRKATATGSARQIAEIVGVSIATVSRALNAPQQVTPETRARVLETAERLGYRPNPLGRNLVVGRSHLVGLIVPNIGFPLYGLMARSIEDILEPLGLRALLASSDDDATREIEAAQSLLRHAVDGGIVINSRANELLPRGPRFPWVHISPEAVGLAGAVELDNRAGGRLAGQHLLGLGRRRLAHVAGPGREGDDRETGWLEALGVAGVKPVDRASGDYSEAAGRTAILEILERVGRDGLDGVFLAGDMMAAGAMRVLREAGLRVPEDVAVIGFDDAEFAAMLEPSLTTVRQPASAMGAAAARLLLQSYEHNITPSSYPKLHHSPQIRILELPEPNPPPVLFAPELVVRRSTV